MAEVKILENGNIRVTLPITIRNVRSRKLIIFPDQQGVTIAGNGESLLLNLARAFRWQGMIDRGEFRNATELSNAVGRNQAYVSRILRMTLLSPQIVHAIIMNTLPSTVTTKTFRFGVPARWEEQHKLIGLG